MNSVVIEFALRHKLKAQKDQDETNVIPGRTGHIYEHSADRLGVLYSSPKDKDATRWLRHMRACIAAGIKAKTKRVMSETAKLAGTARLASWRTAQRSQLSKVG